LVEHTLGKGEVSGSNPLKSSIIKADMKVSAFILSGWLGPVFWLQAWVQVVDGSGLGLHVVGLSRWLLKSFCQACIMVGLISLLGQ
jgi:hypothetical protein